MKGKRRSTSWGRNLAWHAEEVARQIAVGIMECADGPEKYCEDPVCPGRVRYWQAVADAAVAIEVGRGNRPVVRQEPPCSAVVAAEARMAAGQR